MYNLNKFVKYYTCHGCAGKPDIRNCYLLINNTIFKHGSIFEALFSIFICYMYHLRGKIEITYQGPIEYTTYMTDYVDLVNGFPRTSIIYFRWSKHIHIRYTIDDLKMHKIHNYHNVYHLINHLKN